MKNGVRKSYTMEALHGAHPALHCLQGIACNMGEIYEDVEFPLYGGTSRMGTLFLTRKLPGSQKVSLSIQQTSDTRLEAFVIGKSAISDVRSLIAPLIEEYEGQYPGEAPRATS